LKLQLDINRYRIQEKALKKRSHITLLIFFVTFLIMNPIFFYGDAIAVVGKYGKLVTALIGIMVLQKSPMQIKYFAVRHIWLILFWVLCVFFMFLRIIEYGIDFELIQNNILFMVFIYFLYLLSTTFAIRHRVPNYYFFKYLVLSININFFFWLIIAFVFGISLWTEGPRTGLKLFFESYVILGIVSSTAAIANFSLMKYKTIKSGKMNFLMFVLYSFFVIMANSRNAQLILGVFLLLNLWPYLKKIAINYIYVFVVGIAVLLVFFFSGDMLLNENVKDFTTGRSTIWFYIYEHYLKHSILLGEGIFGLNNTILIANTDDSNYYFSKIDTLYFHSSFIEAMTAAGLIGLLFFIVFIIKCLREKKRDNVVIIIISMLVGGLFESFLVQPTMFTAFLFWYLIIGRKRSLIRT